MSKKKTNKKTHKKLPNNISEDEFLIVLDNISKRLAHKFKFAYHSFDDMKQQAAIFALEGLEKYDNKRPLENFLWTHVRNRLFNYKRDNYQRPDKPCLSCIFYDPHCKKSYNQCEEYKDKNNCEELSTWNKRNETKKNLIQPMGIEDLSDSNIANKKNYDILNIVSDNQIIKILDQEIPAQYRTAYLKLKYGDKIYKSELLKLIDIIKTILHKYNYEF